MKELRQSIHVFFAIALVAIASAAAMAAPQDRSQADATPAGKWTMAIKSPHGPLTLSLEVKIDGRKVTGWLAGEEVGRLPITGEYAEGKLTFVANSDHGDLTYVGKLKDKDTLVGDLSSHVGDLPCTATRVKEK
jgi:hypothetical protein